MDDPQRPARIHHYFRAYYARQPFDLIACPPFSLLAPRLNSAELIPFAIPDQPPGDDVDARLTALQALALERVRHAVPLAFVLEFAPALATALQRQGYQMATRRLMCCHAAWLRNPPAPDGLEWVALTARSPERELITALRVNRRGFDRLDLTISPDDVQLFQHEIDGGCALLAYLHGVPAGMGEFSTLNAGVTRLAGITTLPEFRRRGIAAALSAELTRIAFASGADLVFLVARDEPAARVYANIGYQDCGAKVSFHP